MEGDSPDEDDEEELKEPPPQPTRFGWVQGVMVGRVRPARILVDICDVIFFYTVLYIFNLTTANNCLSIDPLHVKYLGGDLVPEVALDHCSSWYRYVMANKTLIHSYMVDPCYIFLFAQIFWRVVHESFSQAFILSFCLSPCAFMSGLTWVIILVSSCITGITGLSTSAIATNGKVKGGLLLTDTFNNLLIKLPSKNIQTVPCLQVGPTS